MGAVLGAVFGILCTILYDRYKRPTSDYNFTFEKEVAYQGAARGLNIVIPTTGYFQNYIRIENYGVAPLFNISTKIWFNTRKERRYYQTMEISEDLFDLEVEQLSEYSHMTAQLDVLSSLLKGAEEVFEEKTKQGFFIPDKAMEKLKHLSPIKVKVEYDWGDNNYSDIWLFDFSDENEVRFNMLRFTFWQKTKRFLKKLFS